MYSYEQRIAAVELYIKYGLHASKVINELGYPNRHSLALWYKEYKKNNGLHKSLIRTPKFTQEQRRTAIEHYMMHGKCITYTVKALGYPSRSQLKLWLREEYPAEHPSCINSRSLVELSEDQKEQAAIDLCTREGSAQEVADKYGVSRYSVYNWAWQMLGKGNLSSMPKKTSPSNNNQNIDELRSEVERLNAQADELKRQVYRLQLEKDVLEKAAEIIKKEQGVSLKTLTNREKAMVIGALRESYPLKDLLSVFSMAKSSYSYQRSVLNAQDKYKELRISVRTSFDDSGHAYGYRRIHADLRNTGNKVSEKVIRRIMKDEGLAVYHGRKRHYSSYQGEISPAVPNRLNRDFHADKPNEKWLTDITEFSIPAGKVYLSPIIDCFDGLPVSWTIGSSPNAELVNTMLDAAVMTLHGEHPIVHSDRGAHYRWPGWIERMDNARLIRSMSKKGCSPDNSACEGFFGRLKNEMFYGHSWKDVSIEQFIECINNYIKWYSEKRIKLTLGGKSPLNYRRSLGLSV